MTACFELFRLFQKPINPSVTEEPPSLFGGFGGINPGGQLLNAAIGVTRAVSQFLGVALQVCPNDVFTLMIVIITSR